MEASVACKTTLRVQGHVGTLAQESLQQYHGSVAPLCPIDLKNFININFFRETIGHRAKMFFSHMVCGVCGIITIERCLTLHDLGCTYNVIFRDP
jgi:hypothetical protein